MSKKINKNSNVNNKHSSIASDYNDDDHGYTESEETNEKIKKKEKKIKPPKNQMSKDINDSVIEDSFMEKIVKYIKIDNLIRKETVEYKEKINTLKEEKQEMEAFILRYLDTKDEKVIQIADSGKLTKYESVRKSSLNKDIIKQSIVDQIKKEKIITDETRINELAELTCQLMDSKRETKTKTVLKRTFTKKKNNAVNNNSDSDEEKPKKHKNNKKNNIADDEKPKKTKKI